jgi:hypothetical protein
MEDEMDRACNKILVVKPQGKRALGRPRCSWEDNIKMDLKEKGGRIWTGLTWLRRGSSGRLV